MDPSEELRALRQEAAALRYELARLRDRRTVRAALAVSAWPRGGPRSAWAALRGRGPRLDVPGPVAPPPRPPFPHLRVVATGSGDLLTGACSLTRVGPGDAALILARDRPDLLLLDELQGWDRPAIADLVGSARRSGAAVVTVGGAARAAVSTTDLHVDVTGRELDALHLPPPVDVRAWSPTGLDTAAPAHQLELGAVGPVEARRQPVVVAPEASARRTLTLMSAGALVVTVRTPVLASALEGLDEATTALVLAEPDATEEALHVRAGLLLSDDDLRHRVSVRLRRVIHRRCSTRRAVLSLVAALGWDDPPSERISVLLPTRRPDRLAQVLEDLAGQRHPDVELILLVHGDGPVPEPLPPTAHVRRVPADRPLGAVLAAGLEVISGAYAAKVDDDDRYGGDHLGDLVLALQTSGADLVGRRTHGVYLEEHDRTIHPPPGGEERFEDHLPGGTLLLPADVLRAVRWRHVPRAVDTELVRAVHLAGGSAYSSHRYGYVRVRHDDHTYDAPEGWAGSHVEGFDASLLEA